MTILTILELLDNYHKNILVEAHREKKDSLYSVCCYMTREGDIHKLMLSTNPVFKDHNEAVDAMHLHIKETILDYSLQTKMYKGLEVFTDEEIDKFIDRTLDLEEIEE